MNKAEFVAKCGELLHMAKPNLVKCEYSLGKDMDSGIFVWGLATA